MDAILNRRPPTFWSLFWQDPLGTLAKRLHTFRQSRLQKVEAGEPPIIIGCISDTHNTYPSLPPGDLLIHAGDLSQSGTKSEIQATLDWLAQQPHQYKVVIAGNHELLLDSTKNAYSDSKGDLNWHDITYLQDSSTTLRFQGGRALKVYGSPWTRKYGNWAFEYPVDIDHWTGTVPDDMDVLVTHMPPFAHLDIDGGGDKFLLQEVKRVKPRLHVFGHLHGGHGREEVRWDEFEDALDKLMGRKGSVWNLLRMCWYCMNTLLLGGKDADSTLVNAAIVQGYKDKGRREAIVVEV